MDNRKLKEIITYWDIKSEIKKKKKFDEPDRGQSQERNMMLRKKKRKKCLVSVLWVNKCVISHW